MITLLAQQTTPETPPETPPVEAPLSETPTGDLPATTTDLFKELWQSNLFEMGGREITVSSLVVGLVLIIVGFWLAGRLARLVGVQVGRANRVNPSAVLLIERLVYYTLVVVAVLAALDMMGLNITTFAFLGGAIAIGLGFGAQNVLNNFISGVILMVEQPIRIGDLIEVDNEDLGHVERIHARFTRVRRLDGIDVLIPNSKLLEETVVNWTLTDDICRTSVVVGVIYGSPTDLVRDLILKAANAHERVLQQPKPPICVFNDFGDNALIFEVFFWTHARSQMQLRELQSDIRFTIDASFREHDLVIAFPQRDVHLDTVSPLKIQMMDGGGES